MGFKIFKLKFLKMKLFAFFGLALGQRNFGPNFPDEMDLNQLVWLDVATTAASIFNGTVSEVNRVDCHPEIRISDEGSYYERQEKSCIIQFDSLAEREDSTYTDMIYTSTKSCGAEVVISACTYTDVCELTSEVIPAYCSWSDERNFGAPNFPDELDVDQSFWTDAATASMMGEGDASLVNRIDCRPDVTITDEGTLYERHEKSCIVQFDSLAMRDGMEDLKSCDTAMVISVCEFCNEGDSSLASESAPAYCSWYEDRNFPNLPNFPDEMDSSQSFWIDAAKASTMGNGVVSQVNGIECDPDVKITNEGTLYEQHEKRCIVQFEYFGADLQDKICETGIVISVCELCHETHDSVEEAYCSPLEEVYEEPIMTGDISDSDDYANYGK